MNLSTSPKTMGTRLRHRFGEAFVVLAAILIGFGLWVGSGDGGAIAHFLLWLSTITGLLFGGWGALLRFPHTARGGLAGAALATLSQAAMLALLVSTGFEAVWLPWLVLNATAMLAGFGIWRHRRARRV